MPNERNWKHYFERLSEVGGQDCPGHEENMPSGAGNYILIAFLEGRRRNCAENEDIILNDFLEVG